MLAAIEANALTFGQAFDSHMKLAREKKTKVKWLNEVKKKDLTKNKLKGDNGQGLISGDDSVRLTPLGMDMSLSRSSVFESIRFRWKSKFQVRGEDRPWTNEIEEFWTNKSL